LSKNILNYFWGNNNKILYLMDNNGDENFHLLSVDINGNNLKDLTPFDNVKTEIIDELSEIDSEMLIGLNKINPEIFDAYRVNIESGEIELAAKNPGNISVWIADHNGFIRAALTTDGLSSSLLYREDERQSFKTILTFNFRDSFIPLFFSFDNKNLYASSNLGRDKNAIVLFNMQKAEESEVIFEHPEVDVYSLYYSKKRKVITYVNYVTWKNENVAFDKEFSFMFETIYKDLGKYQVFIVDSNKDEDRFIIRKSSAITGSYYIYNKLNNTLTKLVDLRPWLNENDLAETKPISFISRDGLTIHGYLTLPNNFEPKNLPAVMRVHGGPWARDDWSFNNEVQFLASRGYAVLNINYRGSTGYGRKFWEASFKQWGKAMQDDLTDGVKWLIDRGIADPKRVAIFGSSYGGYAVLAGLTFTPDLYACGIDVYGISNIFTFINSVPPYWKPYLESFYEMVGHPENDHDLLKEISPLFHIDKIKVPLLIEQGRMDARVNIKESDQVVAALKASGVEVEYFVKDNEGHGHWKEENCYEAYGIDEKFLEKYLLKKLNF
jgi:dipeptidyl aminopeptidase/acylaminoacyl peptidase